MVSLFKILYVKKANVCFTVIIKKILLLQKLIVQQII